MNVAYEQLIIHYDQVATRFRALLADVGPERAEFKFMFTTIASYSHGIDHWARVGIYCLAIAHALREQGRVPKPVLAEEGGLEEAALLAAFFHDCARVSDGYEIMHGRNGERVWRHYAERRSMDTELRTAVSQALIFHVDHSSFNAPANAVTICLCNADRLDRIRLCDPDRLDHVSLDRSVDPKRMYEDGIWPALLPHSRRLYHQFRLNRVKLDLGLGDE